MHSSTLALSPPATESIDPALELEGRAYLHQRAGSDESLVEAPQPELTEAVRRALTENQRRWDRATSKRRFLDPAFEFVRLLKAGKEFAALDAAEAADLVESLVPSVWRELPSQTTLGDPVDAVSCFLDAWETVEFADGAGSPVRQAVGRAVECVEAEEPVEPSHFGLKFSHARYKPFRTFLRVLELLQEEAGSEPIALPQGVMAQEMGCHQTQVSRWIRNAIQAQLLVREVGASRREHRAAEYRLVVCSQIRGSRRPGVNKSVSPSVLESGKSWESGSQVVHLESGEEAIEV